VAEWEGAGCTACRGFVIHPRGDRERRSNLRRDESVLPSQYGCQEFLAPLERLPAVNGFSDSGRFTSDGPEVLRVNPPREPLVMSDHGRFEAVGDLDGGRHADAALNWVVDSELTAVSGNGRREKVIKRKSQYIARIAGFQGRDFGFSGRVSPGIYRLDISFQGRSGKTLTRRAEWFRVMHPFSDLRLAVDATTFRSDDTGSLRVLNYGNVKSTFSFAYRIRKEGGGSESLPLEESGVMAALLPAVHPGDAGSCFRFHIPKDTPAGRYEVGVKGRDRLAAPRWLWAKFAVE
jgi:hypothetical protein